MASSPRVIQVGLGPIGQDMAKRALARGYHLVGAIDVAPELEGKALSEVLGADVPGTVVGSPEAALEAFAGKLQPWSRSAAWAARRFSGRS